MCLLNNMSVNPKYIDGDKKHRDTLELGGAT